MKMSIDKAIMVLEDFVKNTIQDEDPNGVMIALDTIIEVIEKVDDLCKLKEKE